MLGNNKENKSPDLINEKSAKIYVYRSNNISSNMPVFYNPIMEENRTISLIIAKSFFNKPIRALFPLEATGVRAIRFFLEGVDIKEAYINDINPLAYEIIKENVKLNGLENRNIKILNEDARLLMLREKNFDYIDIDPFGTPNPFLEISLNAIKNNGLLAITSTDISSLAGTYPSTCKWKYWAIPIRNHLKHEGGIRILIRKVQLIGAHNMKAVIPIFCYYSKHYYRCFFKVLKSKNKALKIINNHKYLRYNKDSSYSLHDEFLDGYYGPFWAGELCDKEITKRAMKLSENYDRNVQNIINLMLEDIAIPFFYDTSTLLQCGVIKKQPKIEELINALRNKGFEACRTIFSPTGFKTNASIYEIKEIIQQLS